MTLVGETQVAARPRRPARRPGFLGEMAGGVAGAVLSAPGLAAVVLLATTLGTVDFGLVIGLAHLAGMALSRMRTEARLPVLCGWIALATLYWYVDSGGWTRGIGVTEFGVVRIVVALFAVAWGAGSRRVWIFSIVVVSAGALALSGLHARDAGSVAMTTVGGTIEPLLYWLGQAAVMFVLVGLGRRGWPVSAIVVAVLALVATAALTAASGWLKLPPAYFAWWGLYTVCTFIGWLVPIVCGMAARAAAVGAPPDEGARFVTTLARRPWTTALVFGAVLYATANWSEAFLPGGNDPASRFATLGRTASASALLAMLASGAAGSLGALAPVCVASAVALATWLISALVGGGDVRSEVVAHRAVRCAAYLLPQILVRAALVQALAVRNLVMPLVAIAVVLPPAAWSEGVDASPWVGVAWIVLVIATFVAVATCDHAAVRVVAAAVVLGLVQRLAMELMPAKIHAQLQASSWFQLPAAWMLAAVFALIARRARTMTAVPVDHPMFVDFARAA